jgi:hypothetical protein
MGRRCGAAIERLAGRSDGYRPSLHGRSLTNPVRCNGSSFWMSRDGVMSIRWLHRPGQLD